MNITKHSQAFAIFMIVWFPISILYLHAVGGGQDDLFLAFCLFIVLWVLGQDRDQSKQNGERKGIKIENLLFSLFLFFVERIIALICRYIVQADPTYHEDTARMEVPMIVLYIVAIIVAPLWEEFIFRKCMWMSRGELRAA